MSVRPVVVDGDCSKVLRRRQETRRELERSSAQVVVCAPEAGSRKPESRVSQGAPKKVRAHLRGFEVIRQAILASNRRRAIAIRRVLFMVDSDWERRTLSMSSCSGRVRVRRGLGWCLPGSMVSSRRGWWSRSSADDQC